MLELYPRAPNTDPHFINLSRETIRIILSAEEYSTDDEFRSDAPRGIFLEQYKERMQWIKTTAQRYHQLMSGSKSERMFAELRKLAAWDG